MPALNEKALGKYKGNLFIREVGSGSWIDMGAVRALVASLDGTNVTEINSDNRGTLIKFVDLQASISVTALETFSRDKLNILFNTTSSNVAGTPVPVTNEAVGTSVAAGTIYVFANKNGANTQVASISVADTGGTLVLNTDYTIGVNAQGETYIVFLAASTGATVVNYTYTPNEAEQAIINIGTNELKNFEVKIEADISSTVDRIITLSSATINSTYSLGFTDVIENGDVVGADLVFD
jgi:hypothetical protein